MIKDAAASIVGVLPTGDWAEARAELVSLFGALDPSSPPPEIEVLDRGRQSLLSAAPPQRQEIAAETRGAVQALLGLRRHTHPRFTERLQAVIAEMDGRAGVRPHPAVHQVARARDNARIYQAGRDIGPIRGDAG